MENSVNFVDNNYHQSFDCSTVPAHRQAVPVVDNHNHNENRSHITHTSMSGAVEGLASVEERLVFYKKNEGMLCDQIAILKSDASFNEAKIITLKKIIEKLKKEKADNLLKINNYDNATKSLDKVIGSPLVNNNKKGIGYNAVPPPSTGLFAPLIIDLSHSGIEKFKELEFEGYGPKASKNVNIGAPIIEDWESDSDDEDDKPKPKVVKKTFESKTVKQDVVSDGKLKRNIVFPTAAKIEVVKPKQQEKPVRKPVKYAEMYISQKKEGIKEIGIIRSPIN
ncbi:hypothetical protein Tco_0312817 [Tanacetum coccineum]